MTDKQVLLAYRLKQAEETLLDAERMLEGEFSPRSVVNRAYYSMFYSVLALFLFDDVHVKTSKHAGIISTFDREFIHTRKIDPYYSKLFHKMFDIRQEGDYKELVVISKEEAYKHVSNAKEFVEKIKAFIREKAI
jgi:uncharacterized protein (UPF0332 family)